MNSRVLIYIDAPQHLRIAATLIGSLEDGHAVVVIGPLATSTGLPGLARRPHIRFLKIERPPLDRLTRPLRLLIQGLTQTFAIRRLLPSIAPEANAPPHVVVFNDTGIAQRYLIGLANRNGWTAVLVQDGLTETQHREDGSAFIARAQLTKLLLNPLGLSYLGTSRYGTAGAGVVLADGPFAAEFFRSRSPTSRVVVAGLLRPGTVAHAPAAEGAHVLFWAVDFLGGLQRRDLHELQLQILTELASAMSDISPSTRLRVRLHPGDAAHIDLYRQRLSSAKGVDLVDPSFSPDPFDAGRPVLSVSLQSAGVFDALAAGIPSFFLVAAGQGLAPPWTPSALLLSDARQFGELLQRLLTQEHAGRDLWYEQTRELRPRVQIPFDAARVRAALN